MSKPYAEHEFLMSEIFDIHTPAKKFNANEIKFGGKYPYVARGSSNNGIRGYITEATRYLNPARTLSFGQDTATVYYQENAYFTGDKIKIMELRGHELTESIALYLIPVIRKAFSNFSWGQSSFNENVLNNIKIILPVTVEGTPDWEYMQERIAELEQERIAELDAYLKVTGLDDYELTEEDKEVLSLSTKSSSDEAGTVEDDKRIRWKEYLIGDLFYKVTSDKRKGFDKRKDTKTRPDSEYSLPLVNAKLGENGIMFYGRPEDFTAESMTIDIVQNGAVATGKVYPQPQPTGVLWDAYLIKLKDEPIGMNEQILLYLASVLEKTIRDKFSYDKKATWERVRDESIALPVCKSGIQWEYIQKYIRATEKLVIAETVKWKNTVITAAKSVVS